MLNCVHSFKTYISHTIIQLDRVQSQDLEVKRIIYTASIYKYKDYMVVAINIYLHIKHRFCNYL